MHTADCYCHRWDKEQDGEDVGDEVARDEDVYDASSEINNPCEENEVPELKSGGDPINDKCLAQGCGIDINKVLHKKILLESANVLREKGQNLICIIGRKIEAMRTTGHSPINNRCCTI